MTTLKDVVRDLKKKSPKAFAEYEKRWDCKMTNDVMEATFEIAKHINPKAKKAIGKEEWLFDGQEIEEVIWRLLRKARRITQAENRTPLKVIKEGI